MELIKALEHIRLGLHYQQTSGSELFSKRFYFTPSSITYFTDNMKIMVLQTETEMLPPPPPKKKKKRRKKKREWPLRAGGKKGGGGEVFKIPEVNEPEVISLDQECRVYTLGRNWTTANPIIVPQTQIKKKNPPFQTENTEE